ncbi:MAG TPA: hypothetical protein PLF40_00360 [Kofleriaceae bacterium]|nr:hypothetical protein [Kofleriaceae bacterium]
MMARLAPQPLRGWLLASLLLWVAIGIGWLRLTRGFHATDQLAAIATASLVTAYAAAAYLNHLVLIPRYWRTGQHKRYALTLLAAMLTLTAIALAVLRTFYIRAIGPAAVNRLEVDFALDFFGMLVHVSAAALVVHVLRKR